MTPAPITAALPGLATKIEDERPLIASALLDIRVTRIDDTVLHCAVSDPHSYEILTSPRQWDYLNKTLSAHFGRDSTFDFTLNLNGSQLPPTPRRTANTLTYHERKALENWMQQPDNALFVAHESDADAARQASKDLTPTIITPGNIGSMRKLLGLEKAKPEKPQPPALPEGLTLADLQARVQDHEERIDAMHVHATGMKATLAELHRALHLVIATLDEKARVSIPQPLPLSESPSLQVS